MKKILCTILCLSAFVSTVSLSAQTKTSKKVPLSVYVSEQAEYIPQIAQAAMAEKLRQIVMNNGMAATDDVGQFYITCIASVSDKEILGGAPTKFAQKMDLNFYVVDAFGQKIFGTTTLPARGVGDNENKAYIAALRQVSPKSPALKGLVEDANAKIIAYYNEQGDNIIQKARTLALAKQYEEAFFQLSLIPEACEGVYAKALAAAAELFQKYIDDLAAANLAKARSIWAAGQNSEAAEAAAEYLGQITPDAACYPQAVALSKEISARISKTIDWEQKQQSDIIKSWRDIGVAYGNNQKSVTYNPVWLVR